MSDTSSQTSDDISGTALVLILFHATQLVIAVVILGLNSYGVHHVAYNDNDLVYSIVVCVCTIIVCAYMIGSRLWFRKLWVVYVVAAYHAWMLIFWAIDLGLVSHLAHLWHKLGCIYDFNLEYSCAPYDKYDVDVSPITTYKTYYGALVAEAVLSAFELLLWILSTSFLFLRMKKHRLTGPVSDRLSTQPQQNTLQSQRSPSTLSASNPAEAVDMSSKPWGPYPPPSPRPIPKLVIPDISSADEEHAPHGHYFDNLPSNYRLGAYGRPQPHVVVNFGRPDTLLPSPLKIDRPIAARQLPLTQDEQERHNNGIWRITNPSPDSPRSTPDKLESRCMVLDD